MPGAGVRRARYYNVSVLGLATFVSVRGAVRV